VHGPMAFLLEHVANSCERSLNNFRPSICHTLPFATSTFLPNIPHCSLQMTWLQGSSLILQCHVQRCHVFFRKITIMLLLVKWPWVLE